MQSIKIIGNHSIIQKLKRKKLWIFILMVAALVAYYTYQGKVKREVLRNYDKTYGRISDYYVIGAEAANYMEYEYNVNKEVYKRKIGMATRSFEKCIDNLEYCKKKKFWVIYSPENPKKSLINLKIEIQGMENPPFPKSLDDFE